MRAHLDQAGPGLGEDGADRRGDHLRGTLGDDGEDVADEVDSAALPDGAEHDLADGFDPAAMAVGDDRADADQTAFAQ
ncbi:hypothetical protein GCM10009540_36670 [Streptomyces turgidiscabies]